jgi:tRNA-dihydrouridine synthase B
MKKQFPKLQGKIILAPMHKITNLPFRILCKEYGASLVSTELLSAEAIAKNNNLILKIAKTCKEEKPICAQIFSNNIENMIVAAKVLEKDFEIIDINLGCPSNKIVKQGFGGALLKDKNKIYEIVSKISNTVTKPITVKIRSGFDENSINSIEIAKICETAGASAITIHARTVKQGYSGKADWNIIKQIKNIVKIPVIGNGDIFTPQDAEKMLKQTKCDYVMIGRATIGNPFIFKQTNHYLKTGKIINQTKNEKVMDYFEYLKLCKKCKILELNDIKLKALDFSKGISGSSRLRKELNSVKNIEDIREKIKIFIRMI